MPSHKKRKTSHNDTVSDDTMPGRQKTSDSNQTGSEYYVLNRNYAATTRLNSQHLLWKFELGWCLHPSLQPPIPSTFTTRLDRHASNVRPSDENDGLLAAHVDTFRVADLATGTAIWALDIVHSLSWARVDCFDIDLQQCPPAEWLPHNVTVRKWDIFSDLAPELEGLYDVVHIRLLLLVIENNDPRPLLKNALRMLKKGGYLQWDELDPWKAYTVVVEKQLGGEAERTFQKKQELTDMSTLKWVLDLHSIIDEVGFENVRRHAISCDIRLAKYYQDMQFMVMEEQAASKATVEERVMVEKAIREGVRESREGKARLTPKVVYLGKKPME